MRVVRSLARTLCTVVALIAGFYTVVAIAIAVFIVSGELTPGSVMFYDSSTPTLSGTLGFVVTGPIVVAAFAYARHRLKPLRASA